MPVADLPAPEPKRIPRKGDKFVKPRHAIPGTADCIAGEVISAHPDAYGGPGHVTVAVAGSRRTVHMERQRFTWSRKRLAWVCWPKAVVREVLHLERTDGQVLSQHLHGAALVGDFVMIGKRAGWVMKLISSGEPVAVGVLFETLKGYVVSTLSGPVEIRREDVIFDPERRLWSARA